MELSIATYVRIKPQIGPTRNSLHMNVTSLGGREHGCIDYAIQGVSTATTASSSSSVKEKGLLCLRIPVDVDPGLVHNNKTGLLEYEFDHVFDSETTQDEVFLKIAQRNIDEALLGINSTIFAYGQTGSGKTYTMSGGDSFKDRGIIPRTVGYLFEKLREKKTKWLGEEKEKENEIGRQQYEKTETDTIMSSSHIHTHTHAAYSHKVQVSFTEVYNEVVYDLLDVRQRELPLSERTPVQILEGAEGLIIRNLNVYEVQDESDALGLFFMGSTSRIQDATCMNNVSSRSHAIFTILVETTVSIPIITSSSSTSFSSTTHAHTNVYDGRVDNDQDERKVHHTTTCTGKINLVDLAGSERMYKMQNTNSQRKDAKNINLSLHYLEQVILSLRNNERNHRRGATNGNGNGNASKLNVTSVLAHFPTHSGHGNHVPYRNSVLTSMLRDSLGGNCRSCFILTLSVDKMHFEESISTCRFGQRCGEVRIRVAANVEVPLQDQILAAKAKAKATEQRIALMEQAHEHEISALNAKYLALEEKYNSTKAGRSKSARGVGHGKTSSLLPLPLPADKQEECRVCVQELLQQARSALQILQAASKCTATTAAAGTSTSTVPGYYQEPSLQEKNEAAIVQKKAMRMYVDTIREMEEAQLCEMGSAMGQLVLTLFTEREMLIFKESFVEAKQTPQVQTHAQGTPTVAVSTSASGGSGSGKGSDTDNSGCKSNSGRQSNPGKDKDKAAGNKAVGTASASEGLMPLPLTLQQLAMSPAPPAATSSVFTTTTTTAENIGASSSTSDTLHAVPSADADNVNDTDANTKAWGEKCITDSANSTSKSQNKNKSQNSKSISKSSRDRLTSHKSELNSMAQVLLRGNYFLKASQALGTKNVRFVCVSSDLSCMYWRRVEGNSKPSMVLLRNMISLEILGRNSNTILITVRGQGDSSDNSNGTAAAVGDKPQTLRFKYVNGVDAADSANVALFWCDALRAFSVLARKESDRKANIIAVGQGLQGAGVRARGGGGQQKVPPGMPVRSFSTTPHSPYAKDTISTASEGPATRLWDSPKAAQKAKINGGMPEHENEQEVGAWVNANMFGTGTGVRVEGIRRSYHGSGSFSDDGGEMVDDEDGDDDDAGDKHSGTTADFDAL